MMIPENARKILVVTELGWQLWCVSDGDGGWKFVRWKSLFILFTLNSLELEGAAGRLPL